MSLRSAGEETQAEHLAHAATIVRQWIIDRDDPDVFRLVRYGEFDPHMTIEALASMVIVLLGAIASGEGTSELDELANFAGIALPAPDVHPLLRDSLR